MGTLWQDLRYGTRMLAKNPGFTAVAILTLALGIGANTAIFSVVYSVLWRNLPFPDPDRLVFVWVEGKDGRKLFSPPDFVEFQEQVAAFAEVGAIRGQWMVHLTADGRPNVVRLRPVTPNFLEVYGVQPYLGRAFRPEDDIVIPFEAWGNPDVTLPTSAAMISYGFWQSRFGGDPDIIGKLVQLEYEPHQIIGVVPPNFKAYLPDEEDHTAEVQVWTLSGMDFRRMPRDVAFLRVVGRLKPGVTREQAQAQTTNFAERQRREYSVHRENGYELRVVPLQSELASGFQAPVLVLFGAVVFVLLIACTNLANLLLARGSSRRKEFAVRLALGSGRTRLIRQVLTESWLYALLGGGAGLLLASWLVELLPALAPRAVPRMNEIGLDGPVLAFTLGLSVFVALLLGLLPALRFSGPTALRALQEAGRGPAESGYRRRDGYLVVGQVALSVVLVIGTGLLLRSFVLLLRVDPGFRPANVLTADMSLSSRRYPRYPSSQPRVRFTRQVSERLSRLPGVEAVGLTLVIPLSRQDAGHSYASEEMAERLQTFPPAKYRPVTPGYFQAAGTRLLSGRDFTWTDLEQERLVVVVDETLARTAWPGQDPLGKRLRVEVWSTRGGPIHLEPLWTEVVGVVEKVHSRSLSRLDMETVYLPYGLYATSELSVLVRSASDPRSLIEPVRQEVQSIDSEMTVFNIRRMEDFLWDSVAPQRFSLTLLGAFGAIGLLLAAIGLYGVLYYSVSRRVYEIGVRMALGARPRDVIQMVLAQGMLLTGSGVLLGVGGALALTRLLKSQLYEVSPTDPMTFAAVIALILLVSLLACYIPAQRAAHVDPMVALRYE